MEQTNQIDNLKLEQSEAAALLDRGIEFNVNKRKFIIYKPFLGTLDIISGLALDMIIDEEELDGDHGTHYANKVVNRSAKQYAKIVACAVLNSKWKIRLFAGVLAKWFYWNMKAADLRALAQIIVEDRSTLDFLLSIRLIAGIRTTKPNPIEQKDQA